ncbi:MAG: STAS/SEC14 domain-containing protein [Endozoicomonas sp.]|uniref:STAS/SEC14 domain-containing protein n=1 Tax=Endozoicomonas sp. TaxID=1892382 RepID=UPI003D9B27E9
MIKQLPESEGSVLGFEISGKVSLEEEKEWIQKIEAVLENHQKVSILAVLSDSASWGVQAGFEDLKWIMSHMKRLDKIAFVSNSNVWKWLVAADSPFAKMFGIHEQHFEHEDLNKAWQWIRD